MSLDRHQLAKMLGMLGSSFDGEVLAAARAVEKIRQAAGVTWFEIVEPDYPDDFDEVPLTRHDAVIALCDTAGLSAWEQKFVHSLADQLKRGRSLSEKQCDVLDRIIDTHLRR